MKLILPQVKLINQEPGLTGIYKAIARAGHICYASTKEGNEKEFVEQCIKMHHFRPLEFGTVYLTVYKSDPDCMEMLEKYQNNPYSKVWVKLDSDSVQITTNYRVIIENDWKSDLKYIVDTPNMHSIRYTFHWTIARDIADEFRTHVSISSLMQSTRYCDYSKEKFGNELTFVKPHWVSSCIYEEVSNEVERVYYNSLEQAEYNYLKLKQLGCRAEQAREVLPLNIKTEFIQCAFTDAWDNFFKQRVEGFTGPPHPDAKLIAEQAYEQYQSARTLES